MKTTGVSPKDAQRAEIPEAYRARVRSYALDRFFLIMRSMLVVQAITQVVLVKIMWPVIDKSLLLGWLLYGLTLTLLCFGIFRGHRLIREKGEDALRWGHYFTAASAGWGLCWGFAGLFFFVSGSMAHQVMLLTLIAGLAAGALISTAYWTPVFYTLVVPSIALTALRLSWEGGAAYQGLAMMAVLLLLVLILTLRISHRMVTQAIALRFENLELVTQLREQKDLAERANIAKSKFLAAASHDLRQPLHALNLFVAVLRERIQYPEVHQLVENVSQSVSALDGLFQALLDISRLDAGIVEPHVVAFRLAPLVERLAAEYAVQTKAKGLEPSVNCDDCVVRSDPVLLEIILRNLLSNAIRYTARGRVTLRGAAVGVQAHVEVIDTGIGIPADRQEEIFEEFVQLANPERDRNQGLGLGLAIVRRLARQLQHAIEVQSQPMIGSCFRLVLPLGDPASVTNQAPEEPAVLAAALDGMTVIVVDDEAAIQEGMQILLAGWGCVAVTAASAQEAVEALRGRALVPELIIADYRLRGTETGPRAIECIQHEFGREIPGFLITGDTAPERLREAQASGYALLHKPVQPAKLRVILQRLWHEHRRAETALGR